MRTLFFLFLLLISINLSGQDLIGQWIGEYAMEIRKTDETYDLRGDTVLTIKLDTIEIDTVYQSCNYILDFLNEKQLKAWHIIRDPIVTNYQRRGDTVEYSLDTTKFKLLVRPNGLESLDLDSGWRTTTIFYKKMSPVASEPIRLTEKEFANTYWTIETDTSSIYYGTKIHILDSGDVVITRPADSISDYTSAGFFGLFTNDDYTFLWYYDNGYVNNGVFRIYAKDNNGYLAQTFEDKSYDWKDRPFVKSNLFIRKEKLPKEREIEKIKKRLYGKWENNDSFSIERLFPWDSLKMKENQYFSINLLKDGTFNVEYGGDVFDDFVREYVPLRRSVHGRWTLGQTGNYIVLTITDRYEDYFYDDYVTLFVLKRHDLKIELEIESIREDHFYTNAIIDLYKTD